jgi:hypothetical protein
MEYVKRLFGPAAGFFLGGIATSYQIDPTQPFKNHVTAGLVALAGYVSGLYVKKPQ